MAFKTPPALAVVAVLCAGLALVSQVVGVATAAWITSDDTDTGSGLWKYCAGGTCVELSDFFKLTGEEFPGKCIAVSLLVFFCVCLNPCVFLFFSPFL